MIIRLPFPPCALPGAHKKGVTFFGNPFNSLARLAGFEPAAYGLEEITSELPNLLKVKEVFEMTEFYIFTFFLIFANFSIFWKVFHTQSPTHESDI